MNDPKIDLDAEAIWHDDRWYQKDELAAAVRTKLEKGEFDVAALSAALERLHNALGTARVVAFRADVDLADALAAHAQRAGVSIGAVLRYAVKQVLDADPSSRPINLEAAAKSVTTVEPALPEDHANAVTLRPKTGGNPPAEDSLEKSWFRQGGS
jgi:imidazolonepropionase-like amidohydrolase